MAGLEVTADDVEKADNQANSEDWGKSLKSNTEGAGGFLGDMTNTVADLGTGNWAEGALDAVGAAGSVAEFAVDPLAGLLAAGFGWLMEHLDFLKEPLDWLTGDQNAIKAASQTWDNVSKEISEASKQLTDTVKADVAPWHGPAIDAYRPFADGHAQLIAAAAEGATFASMAVSMAGTVLDVVRGIVRDLISKAVADIVACLLEWAAAEALSFGLATPGMIGDAVRRGVQWSNRIMTWVKKVTRVLKKLADLLTKMHGKLDDLKKLLRKPAEAFGKTDFGATHADSALAHGLQKVESKFDDVAESGVGKTANKLRKPFENASERPERGQTSLLSDEQNHALDAGEIPAKRDVQFQRYKWPRNDPDLTPTENLKHRATDATQRTANTFAEEYLKKQRQGAAEKADDAVNGDDRDED